ncbi:PC4/YdbC family ssDNA-binding protein [candidate division CSSED10-310 bacterium]|uniref:PC4/YdbC family ssDNA-binding protein n=1 Tax=candidate division CSSED10-310 bacterium TaxID=2855610 RepID=A0ABV6YVA9_UNCC1
MASSNNLENIASIQKKDNIEIRASLTTWRKDLYIDIREFIVAEEGEESGYSGPTKKGFRFHYEVWEDFKKMVKKIDREIKKRQS